MRAKEFLFEFKTQINERALSKADFYKQDRINNFITNYSNPKPHPENPTIKIVGPFKLTNGQDIFLQFDKNILKTLKSLTPHTAKTNFPGNFIAADGRKVALSNLEKIAAYGGDSPIDNPMGKQALKVKPSDIGISATGFKDPKQKFDIDSPDVLKQAIATGAFPAGQLATKIQTDKTLASSNVGLKVIEMSKQISAQEVPDMPARGELPNTAIAAIRDYGGEYLGVQQLIDNTANFPHSEAFYQFMDTTPEDMKNLMLYFPKASNTPLADSLALQNRNSGHVIKLSSKGGKMGAPPSLDNLKVPDEYRKRTNKNIKNVIKFLDIAREASAKAQPFKLAEFLVLHTADGTISKNVKDIFPVSNEEFDRLYATKNNPKLPCPQKFKKLANIKGPKGELGGSYFGRVHYQINKEIVKAMNSKNALPAFRKIALEILGYNFVQIYSRVRTNKLYADVLWPGTVNGNVELYSKSSSTDPTSQKLSFSIED